MKRFLVLGFVLVLALSMVGCGYSNTDIETISMKTRSPETVSTEGETDVELNYIETTQPYDTLYVQSEVQTIKNYKTVDDLLNDAQLVVKVCVSSLKCANVRGYIYTQYEMNVLDVLYGEIDKNVIVVNMPGGIIEGTAAQAMEKDIFDGKNVDEIPDVERIVSNGNTNYLLEEGDEAYLFLIAESETAYASVGEHSGKMLVSDGKVISDDTISGFMDESEYGNFVDHRLKEENFVQIVKAMLENNE